MVVNPATRQWATWPSSPQHLDGLSMSYNLCVSLVYDPMMSPNHYEVFLTPLLPPGCNCNDDDRSILQQEWLPSPYTAYVFSHHQGVQVGGEIVCPPRRGGCRDHCRYDTYRIPERTQRCLFPEITLCALSKWFRHEVCCVMLCYNCYPDACMYAWLAYILN